jgi:hypothetical protein
MLMLHNFSAPCHSVVHPHRNSTPQAGVKKTADKTTAKKVEARTRKL